MACQYLQTGIKTTKVRVQVINNLARGWLLWPDRP